MVKRKRSFVQTAKSRRYCMTCKKVTTFVLDEITNHSYCKKCDGNKALNPERVKRMENKPVNKLADVSGIVHFYRKKPVKVRAVELLKRVKIETREGELFGEKGDFLIEGIKGEVYPCAREIFFETYDKVRAEETEEVVMFQLTKENGVLKARVSKSASQYEVYGFLTVYLEAMEIDMIDSFEPIGDFELF